ncbi:hypothetical protein CH341_24145 [Rhodoplanes roseus]|uniref:Uncharacterized protein n=1 Tax=Rhodoplanes roseus TaxID=29409 RepID=A0A327KPG1_9BRAD|nr:hypothetical protein CH341_24145 [Rhodoplanes roseus]
MGSVLVLGLAIALAGCTTVSGPGGAVARQGAGGGAGGGEGVARRVAKDSASEKARARITAQRPAAAPSRRMMVIGAGW